MAKVLIVSGEPSSALYAERLLEEWKRQGKKIDAFGVGSIRMEELGFRRLGKSEEMAIVGIVEVIKHYGFLKSVFDSLVVEAKKNKPDVAILLDYPDFNLKLAKELKALGIPVVYYISPQIWAWRRGRIKHMQKYVDEVLCLFPFEMEFYQSEGVRAQFVGHPLLDEIDSKYYESSYKKIHRSKCGIKEDEIVIGLMPGSRRSEVLYNFPIQLEVAKNLYKSHKNIKILIMVAPNFDRDYLQNYLENFNVPHLLIKDTPFEMIHLTDYVLATSGTATLMVGLLDKPMVIMYRVHWFTALLLKAIVRGVIKFFGIVNVILKHEAVPERFQWNANVKELTFLMSKYLDDKTYSEEVHGKVSQIKKLLGNSGATKRVTEAVQKYFKGDS